MSGQRRYDTKLSRLVRSGRLREIQGLTSLAPAQTWEWHRADLLELLNAEPVDIPWLVEGLIARGECLILTAPPKEGKTYVLLQLLIDVALGYLLSTR